jgi:uncharacterized membrane protein
MPKGAETTRRVYKVNADDIAIHLAIFCNFIWCKKCHTYITLVFGSSNIEWDI